MDTVGPGETVTDTEVVHRQPTPAGVQRGRLAREQVRERGLPCCGWQRGLVPISTARASEGSTIVQFAAEPRIRGGRLGLVVFTLGGFIFFLAGMGAHVALGLAGLATLGLGIYAWVVTRFASYRYGLSAGAKAIALTVIFVGRFVVWCSIIGILVNVVADSAFRD